MRTFRSALPIVAVFLFACAADTDLYPQPVNVVYYGDSLVNQSGDRLQKLLPAGSTVDNKGTDAQMASHAIQGAYGHKIDYSHDKVYVIAYGTNEALQGISQEQYRGDINHILHNLQGKRVVIESPPLIRWQQNNADFAMVCFRQTLRELGKAYNATVVDSVIRRDFVDGYHPTQDHYDERAKALADALMASIK